MRRWLFFSLSIWLSALPIGTAEADTLLTSDQRLSKPIRVTLKDASISTILSDIAKAVNVPLLWNREVGDLRASIFVQNQPAFRVLTHLATCLRLAWKQEADGYRLYRPIAVTRDDEQRQMRAAARAQRAEEERQLNEFTSALLRQSHATDEEVKQLAANFPHVAKVLDEEPWFVVGLRVATWLTPEQWDQALSRRLKFDYGDWTLTGPDPDLPTPPLDRKFVELVESSLRQSGKEPRTVAIQKRPGKSGIDNIWVSVQPDGRLSVTVQYIVADSFIYARPFLFGSVRHRR